MEMEQAVVRRVMRRLIPLLIVAYFASYVDRANIGVAALTMNRDLGISPEAFGFGAGIFFLGYFIFEVPSNLMLERFGARRWIARIMLTWGLVSGAMAFVTGVTSFTVVRVLLGIAEAGFFPGVIFYLTIWFPASYRARVLGYFSVALPLSSVIGSPLSAALLGMHGIGGLAGWQWVFVVEAIPSLILSVVIWRYLTDRPETAEWLPVEEKSWLIGCLASERSAQERVHRFTIGRAMLSPAVLALSAAYFGIAVNSYGLAFFLPQIVKAFNLTNLETGFVSAIPFAVGAVAMVFWGRQSDRTGERRLHTAGALAVAGIGMIGAALLPDPVLRLAALCVAAAGTFASVPVFWTLPTAFLSGVSAAVGIAVINSLGNVGGFIGPYAMGYFRQHTGNFSTGLIVVGATALVAATVVLFVVSRLQPQSTPQGARAA